MAVPDDVAHFAGELRAAGTATEVTTFPSGAVMLDVRRGDHLYVLAYSPSTGFGVDEVLDGDGIGTSYRFGFPDFESAKAKVLSLLTEADGHLA